MAIQIPDESCFILPDEIYIGFMTKAAAQPIIRDKWRPLQLMEPHWTFPQCHESDNSKFSFQDMFPFLHREPPSTPESKPRRDVLLSRYEKLLNWFFSGRKDLREMRLFAELKRMANDLLYTDLRRDLCDPLVRNSFIT